MRVGAIHRDGNPIVPQAWLANRPWSRLRGLLARPALQGDAMQALWLVPCGSVHTLGMRYPLDIVFLDGQGRVLDWHEALQPWSARRCRKARQTVEFAPGGISVLEPSHGEAWQWQAA